MKTLSIGKYRGLQQCSFTNGAIAVMALDHRQSLRNALNPIAPDKVSDEELSGFKQQVVSALAPDSSAVLLDPEFGAAQCVVSNSLPGGTGLVTSIEATGYTGDPTARQSQVLPGWSIAKARRMGASAIKLLVYYHPEAESAPQIEALVRQVSLDCIKEDLLFFLETLSYSPDPTQKKLPADERRRVVIETARCLTIPGVDILKAEFPLDIKVEADESLWARACAELSEASNAPWVLLSASVDFETFLRQVAVACRAGATGVAVGRAVWQEAPALRGEERQHFLEKIARTRMRRLSALCTALARPWMEFYTPVQAGSDWYKSY